MKRIEFISPVESMRGNLSGNQELQYPANDNRAYDAPVGVNYARNYRPSFIGAKVAKSGRKYFTVKTKAATKITAATKLAMAALGGAGSVRAAIKRNASLMASIIANFAAMQTLGAAPAKDVMTWIFDVVRAGLISKSTYFDFTYGTGASIRVKNPWVKSSVSATAVTIPTDILVKFWDMLAKDGVVFYVAGRKGIAYGGITSPDTFTDIVASNYNVLGLTIDEIPGGIASGVWMGDSYLTYNNTPIEGGDNPVNDRKYDLVANA